VPKGHLRSLTIRAGAAVLLAVVLAAVSSRAPEGAPAEAAGDCTIQVSLDAEEKLFLTLINDYRVSQGRQPLAVSYFLSRAAQWKSNDMGVNAYFGHDDLFRPWYQRVTDCGYTFPTAIGENIVGGPSPALSAFNAWKNSPGHNSNMLSTSYKAIGIGRAYVPGSPYSYYWTTVFGGVDDGWMQAVESPTPVEPPAASADTTPPSLTVRISRAWRGASVFASASDPSGIARVELFVDGKLYATDTRAPYTFAITRERGRRTIEVRATDTAGNASTKRLSVRLR
jgi:uncharacterized protein YkwD